MTELLCKLFVKDKNNVNDNEVRGKFGTLATIVGIIINLLLFAGKFIIGLLFASAAIISDAFNNLSDAGSSLISFVSFRISSKPADKDHPYGHGRIEYVASMIVSFLILLIGYELFRDGINAIVDTIHGEINASFDILSIIVLGIAILFKLWLFIFYSKIGKKIHSDVLHAAAMDSLGDIISTSAVLISTIIIYFTNWYILDGIICIFVSCLIFKAGIDIFKDTLNILLGEGPSDEIIQNIQKITDKYPEVLGLHDIMVHNYGPNQSIVSLHVEVDGKEDVFHSHDIIDNIESEIHKTLGIICTIHMDPIVTDNELVLQLKDETLNAVKSINSNMNIHDFRFVDGNTHRNLIFDVVVPFEEKKTNAEIIEEICKIMKNHNNLNNCVIQVDRL